ncbi:hypothetical protein QFZ82_007702 [Streptomyces sp. V4I23]|nr:hypothetical protein [Streptomyces sp. V4I23]
MSREKKVLEFRHLAPRADELRSYTGRKSRRSPEKENST